MGGGGEPDTAAIVHVTSQQCVAGSHLPALLTVESLSGFLQLQS